MKRFMIVFLVLVVVGVGFYIGYQHSIFKRPGRSSNVPKADISFSEANVPHQGTGAPQIVSISPANGETEVDPALDKITITFDKKMNGGMSLTSDDLSTYPKYTGLPIWDEEKKTITIPMKSDSNHAYKIRINSAHYKGFASEDNIPLEPVVYTFKTK